MRGEHGHWGRVQLLLSWETDSWVEGHFYNNKRLGKRDTEIHRQVETLRKTERLTVKDPWEKPVKDVHDGE